MLALQCTMLAILIALLSSSVISAAGSAPVAPAWISGALNNSLPTEVCGTCNGCTSGNLFLACTSPTATINKITFAAYGDPSQCPNPRRNKCTANNSQAVIEQACIGEHNCTVSPHAFGIAPSCVSEVADGAVLVMAKALCTEPGLRANQLRVAFTIPAAPAHASVAVSSLGYNQLLCNGKRVSANLLEPGRTSAKRVFYSRFDLKPFLKPGKNVIAAVVGNGWYAASGAQPGAVQAPPALWLNASLSVSGTEMVIVSNGSWKSATGPIVFDSVYQGETHDLRKTLPGWATSTFDDSGWLPVEVNTEASSSALQLTEQTRPAVSMVAMHKPVSITKMGDVFDGEETGFVVDFGRNIAGVVRLEASALEMGDGKEVVIKHCEGSDRFFTAVLNHLPLSDGPKGECFFGELVNAAATDRFVLSSNPSLNGDALSPHFTIHGFRYVHILGAPNVTGDNIQAIQISANVPNTGQLRFVDSAIFQKIQDACINSQRSNMLDIPTDCPQRDERLGWMGDASLAAEQAIYNFAGVTGTYEQWLDMIADEQGDDGSLGDITPFIWQLGTQRPGDPNWGTAYPTVTHAIWKANNNTKVVRRHLSNLVAYVTSLEQSVKASGGLSNMHAPLGDWLAPNDAPKSDSHLVSASAFIHDVRLVAEMAEAIGSVSVAGRMGQLAGMLAQEFNAVWQGNGTYANGVQTELALALELGVVPDCQLEYVVEALVSDIKAHDWHVTTGIVGTRALFEALGMHGRMDVALATIGNPTAPSYGYMVGNTNEPSTTLWENWYADQIPTDQDDASRNHIMFGTVSAFFWKYLAGLRSTAPGWSQLLVAPSFGERCNISTSATPPDKQWLNGLNATLGTAAGTAAVGWRLEGRAAELNVTFPSGASSAEVSVPCVPPADVVSVGGVVVWQDGTFVAGSSPCVKNAQYHTRTVGSVQFTIPLTIGTHNCRKLLFRRIGT